MAAQRVGMSDLDMRKLYIQQFQSGVECHMVSESSQHSQDGTLALAVGEKEI